MFRSKKKQMFFSVLSFTMLFLMVGCLTVGAESQTWSKWLNKWDFKGITLKISHHTGPTCEAYKTLFSEFEKATGAKVIVIEEPWQDLLARHLAEFSAHTRTFDILTWPYLWMGYYVEGKMAEDLNAPGKFFNDPELADPTYKMDDFPVKVMELYGRYRTGKWKESSGLWAVPWKFDIYIAQYRKDIFARVGLTPPATYEELIHDAEIISQEFKDIIPVSFPLAVDDPMVSTLTPLFGSYGGRWLDKNTYPLFHKEAGIEAAKILKRLLPYMPSDAPTLDFDKAIVPMEQGRVAYAENWNAYLPVLLNPSTSKIADVVGFTLTPGGPAGRVQGLGGWNAGISTDSRHKEAAFVLLQYLTGKEKAVEFALVGGSSPRFSVLGNPKVVKKYPYYPLLSEALHNCAGRGFDRAWSEVQRIIGTAYSEILLGAPPEKRLAEAAKRVYSAEIRTGYHPERTGPMPVVPK